MKVIHVPFCFYPDHIGGTEVYVDLLCRELYRRGIQVLVAAPGTHDGEYQHDGQLVRRFRTEPIRDLHALYGGGDPVAADRFGKILDAERPDVVHLHAFTSGVSLRLVREVKQRGIPVVFTYHTPTVSCQRGTLLRWGSEVCDGVLDLDRCTRCALHGYNLRRGVADIVGRVPVAAGKALAATGRTGPAWTALRMRELVHLRQESFLRLMDQVDRVVTVCRWAEELLVRNGVPSHKISVSRHALPHPNANGQAQPEPVPVDAAPLRIAFLGRLAADKGPDTLIRAARSLPGEPIQLDLYGGVQGNSAAGYRAELERLAAGDERIALPSPVPNDQVVSLLRGYHILAVPSRLLETGPLVVLEAFAAGTPVVGSDLGGIAELVEHGVNGLLMETDSIAGWRSALHTLSRDRTLLSRLRSGVRPPRQIDEVARHMERLYVALCGTPGSATLEMRSLVGHVWHRL